jgi:type VI secretion system protein ImpJ
MRNNRELYWHRGLHLKQQHLQQQDLCHQWHLQQLWTSSQPFGWGFGSLVIREQGLLAWDFEVLRCELVTREGLVLIAGSEVDQANAELAPRNFREYMDASGKPMSVYLGLPRYKAGQPNLSSNETTGRATAWTRYRLVRESCPDLLDGAPASEDIGFLTYNLALLFDREEVFASASQAFELVKIAELAPLASGVGARRVENFVPPCLAIRSSSVLCNRLKGIRDLMTNKALELAALRRQRGIRAAAGAQEVFRTTMLQTLTRYIPLFHHYLEIEQIHPQVIYTVLRQLVGELSVFSETISVLGGEIGAGSSEKPLPPYDHDALWPCFEPALLRAETLIRELPLGPEAGILLEFDGEYFKASLSPTFFEGERNRYYLMIDSPIKGPELSVLLQRTGKIDATEELSRRRSSYIPGLKIDFSHAPPGELPQKGDSCSYFAVDSNSPEWKRICERGNIAVFCKNLSASETIIKLFVVKPE